MRPLRPYPDGTPRLRWQRRGVAHQAIFGNVDAGWLIVPADPPTVGRGGWVLWRLDRTRPVDPFGRFQRDRTAGPVADADTIADLKYLAARQTVRT